MSILFLMSMFFLSFVPLWICIIFIEAKSLIDGTDSPYTEWIFIGLIAVAVFISILSVYKTLKNQGTPDIDEYVVITAEKDTISTTAYLLSNALPLLAFDFTQYFDCIQFIVIFGFLAVLCLLHYRCDSNICLELAGYRLYKCKLSGKFEDKEEIIVLIRRKQLNANDEIIIKKLNDELYIGTYKVPEE